MSEDQNVQPQDELSDAELEQVAGGGLVLEERPNPTLGGPDTSSPKISDGTSNTIMIAEQRP
jgi:hypothetical protein